MEKVDVFFVCCEKFANKTFVARPHTGELIDY